MHAPHAVAPKRPALLILVAITALSPLALNIMQPALPDMARLLGTGYGTVQLAITLYLAGFAIAQLGLGPLSDRIGRRPVVLGGTAIFVLGSLVCIFAQSIEVLLLGRVVQALGGAAGFVMARAAVRDMYDREQAASRIGYITMAMVLAPMVAPVLGGLIAENRGWNGIFVLLGAAGLGVLLFAWRAMHETRPAQTEAESEALGLFASFGVLLREPAFLAHAAIMSCSSGTFFGFLGGAPFVVVELMGRPPSTYGYYFAVGALGYMAGNFVAGRFGERLGAARLVAIGTLVGLVGMGAMALCYALAPHLPAAIFVPMTVVAMYNGLVLPGATASALSVRPDLAGAAAGLSGFLQLSAGAVASWLTALLVDRSAWPMIAVMLALVLAAAVLSVLSRRWEAGRA